MENSQILVVNDDQDSCATLADILTDFGYEVDVAYRGWDALDMVKQKQHRLALLDFRLPCMSGIELFDRMRNLRNDLQSVIVSAYITPNAEQTAIEKGVRQVFSKPIDFSQLLPVIQQLAGEPT